MPSRLARRRTAVGIVATTLVVLIIASFRAGAQGATGCAVDASFTRLRCLLDGGQYADADRIATEWRERVAKEQGPDSLEAARVSDYLVEALTKRGKAGSSDTLTLAQRVVRVKAARAGPDDVDLAVSLRNLGTVHAERGEFAAALPLHERSLAIVSRRYGPEDPRIADNLDALALPLILLQRFPEADVMLQRSRRLRDAHAGEPPLALARTLALQALLRRYDGGYAEGMSLVDQALSLQSRPSPLHPDIASTMQLKGDLLLLTGNTDAATMAWASALDLTERMFGAEHPLIPLLLRELALSAKRLGDLVKARTLLEQALPLGERILGPCHQEILGALSDLATLLEYEGDYQRARELFARALSTAQRCLGPNHSWTATLVHNQAILTATMGDLVESERLHQRALRMWSTGLGPNHPYVARALDALAQVVTSRGNLSTAQRLYARALSIRRKVLGDNHPDVAWTLANLAEAAAAAGQPRTALRQIDDAIRIYERSGVSDEPDHLARALELRGTLLAKQGEFASARGSFVEALATRERIFGVVHPLTASAQADVAAADFALGTDDAALRSALDAERIGRDHLRFTIRYLPERQAMAYAATRPRGLDLALSIAAVDTSLAPAQVLDAVIRSRAVILDELAARAQSAALAVDPKLASLSASLHATRQRFATLMLRSLQGEETVSAQTLEDARRQKEDAERAAAEQSVTVRDEATRTLIGVDDIRRALPFDAALVSFLRYDRTSIATRGAGRVITKVPSYIALVSRADTDDVHVVPLGTATSIEQLVDAWRAEVSGRSIAGGVAPREAERTYRMAGALLRLRIWDPLTSYFRGASRIFIVPDGALNLVSFASLPSGNRYLLENGPTIHYLSTERDLIPGDTSTGHGLLAVGGPAFDERVSAMTTAERRSGCGTIGSLHFEDLPGSRAEVRDIERIWGHPEEVLVLTGRAASKTALTRAMVGRKVIHMATHGFFLGSDCDSTPAATRGIGAVVSASSSARTDNPLLMAGLALAGVNQLTRARQVNALLNAEEIAGLNLQGTEWVVLSACDTGVGQITAGEGVFGLRRAFQIAGARTIIMSLWSVEDLSTRQWMKALYEARLQNGLDTPAAVRNASVRTVDERRRRGQSTHPFYWAAFVAAGDWR